jgi:hypothetical protein
MTQPLLAGILFTFILAPLCVFLAAGRIARAGESDALLLFLLCLGITPALIGRIVTWSFYAFAGAPAPLHVAVVVVAVTALGVIGLSHRRLLAAAIDQVRRALPQVAVVALVAGALGCALAAGLFLEGGRVFANRVAAWLLAGWSTVGTGWAGLLPWWGRVLVPLLTLSGLALVWARSPDSASSAGSLRQRMAPLASTILGAGVIFLVLAYATLTLGRPVFENDATQYFKVALLLYRDRSLAHYPMMPAMLGDGMYASSAHPLGQYGLLIWSYLVEGGGAPGFGKLIMFFHVVATLIALRIALLRHSVNASMVAMLVLLATPGYLLQATESSIDAPRLALLLLAMLWLRQAAQWNRPGGFVLAGVGLGLALNSHAETGVLAALAATIGIGLFHRVPWRRRLATAGLVAAVAFLIGGERYVLNLILFGQPIYNDLPIWHIVPQLDYKSWRFNISPRHDLLGRLAAGPLLGFDYFYFFGLSYWLALAGLLFGARRIAHDQDLAAASLVVLATTALFVVIYGFTAVGRLYVMNYRYPLAVLPFVAMICGWYCANTRGADAPGG